ncbi:adenosylcobinamide-GDP ribazoletransferase [Phormidesmis priestleyi ULC007]|uniref:Adenosylcobinamide-GDP ribazoletransferase n=1 Tax=Phormidesmis priestleyi ULC007 TaxID=1920490 RepID=A0A2T1DEV3_9CYAN|nr:adenosylcobinamide-GDP ribazoletransferase [Phormidesmis priestleyi]PSB18983.1 adenosylcobinamide-GDP ribazoletransferase [Phormidesmis priestleyi ULC007]PZO53971.1 MAG: adenosylcobinamide-GDP ribazoletransferase [Phormidesmis priestleyi]
MKSRMEKMGSAIKLLLQQIAAGVAFYTCLPVPTACALEFSGIGRIAPIVGLLIGGLLGILDWGLGWVGMPPLTRSAIVVAAWVAVTGGLHLDGVMDSADGLAVTDPKRRLEVMVDSATGAFGAMAGIVVLLLKTAALSELQSDRAFLLMAAAGWGRWGQLVAIARFPYLKPTGKGAFHKASIQSLWEALPTLLLLVGLEISFWHDRPSLAAGVIVGGSTIAILTGAWFNHKLGGQTGDTYGAIVEWTEALLLCLLTVF